MPSPVHPYSDYGVALRTLKSARGWLGMLLFLCVVGQFVGFSLMWWTTQPYEGGRGAWKPTATNWDRLWEAVHATTKPAATVPGRENPKDAVSKVLEPFFSGTDESRRLNIRNQWDMAYTMLVPVTQISSLIAVLSQAIIVFVTLLIVLMAQAPGVSQITRSLIWSVLLLFMFLPWQYFAQDFPIPGVIYSYQELKQRIGLPVAGEKVTGFEVWMVYGRFIVWPVLGLFVLLITSERFRAGVMIAIGHPLQSMLQRVGGGIREPGVAGGPVGTGGAGIPRPFVPIGSAEK